MSTRISRPEKVTAASQATRSRPVPASGRTMTMRNCLSFGMPGQEPFRGPMVRIDSESSQCMGISLWTPFS